jgi:hemerythrin-like domain-containing protein
MVQVTARPDTQEMVIVHRVFRREYRLAPQMVRAVQPGDVQRARTVAAHLTEMGTTLHHHHAGEDELVWPKLHERALVAGDLVHRMETQHEQVSALLHRADELLVRWAASADATLRDELAGVLQEVSTVLAQHLDEEEREVLPLIAEHMTVAEWSQLGERGMAATPRSRLLMLLGHILEDATAEERATFLGHAPAPARLMYRLVGRRRFEREVAVLRAGIPQQRQG